MTTFRTCVIVASNKDQAARIRDQVAVRAEAGLYPREVVFRVLADPEEGRVGSGGATILAACETRSFLENGDAVLVVNAGGESRRMPTYAPEAKLFAPLPLPSSSRIAPVVLDQQLGFFLRYPWNAGEMVVTSGDVTFDFETGLLPPERGEVYGFAKSESFDLGSRHGVFKFDRKRATVVDFFQKASPASLRAEAALEGSGMCAVDMGLVGFSRAGLQRLFALAESAIGRGTTLVDQLRAGRLSVDLYVELIMAFLSGIPRERYLEKVRPHSILEESVLDRIHGAFQGADFRAFLTKHTQFIHFGSLHEYPASCEILASGGVLPFYAGEDAELRPLCSEAAVQFNSVETTCVPLPGARHLCLESCARTRIDAAGGRNMFIGLADRTFVSPIPAGICLDERVTEAGRFLLAYGVDDTWRPQADLRQVTFCGSSLDTWAGERGIDLGAILPADVAQGRSACDLWDARLFVAGGDERFCEGYWSPSAADAAWRSRFLEGPRASIRQVASAEKLADREERRAVIRQQLLREGIMRGTGWLSIPAWDFRRVVEPPDVERLRGICAATDDDLVRMYRSTLLDGVRPGSGKRDVSRRSRRRLPGGQPAACPPFPFGQA